jgi:hypothetical protein
MRDDARGRATRTTRRAVRRPGMGRDGVGTTTRDARGRRGDADANARMGDSRRARVRDGGDVVDVDGDGGRGGRGRGRAAVEVFGGGGDARGGDEGGDGTRRDARCERGRREAAEAR